MALINCPECKAQISDKAKSCPKCGAPIVLKETFKCFECETELEKGTKVCTNCGAEQEAKEEIKIEKKKEETSNTILYAQLPKKKGGLLMWILIGVGILVLITSGVIILKDTGGGTEEYAKRLQDSINASDALESAKRLQDSIRLQDSFQSAIDRENQSSQNSYSNNNYNSQQTNQQKSTDDLKQELFNKENQTPLDYLTTTYSLSRDVHLLTESKDVINGTIYNSATMATFKDILLSVTFSTKTDNVLATKQYTIYDYFYPNRSKTFQIKVVSPTGTKKIGVQIISAKSGN